MDIIGILGGIIILLLLLLIISKSIQRKVRREVKVIENVTYPKEEERKTGESEEGDQRRQIGKNGIRRRDRGGRERGGRGRRDRGRVRTPAASDGFETPSREITDKKSSGRRRRVQIPAPKFTLRD